MFICSYKTALYCLSLCNLNNMIAANIALKYRREIWKYIFTILNLCVSSWNLRTHHTCCLIAQDIGHCTNGGHCAFPLNTWRNKNVVITSKRRHFDVITSRWRRFDVITTSLLRDVSAGFPSDPWGSDYNGGMVLKRNETSHTMETWISSVGTSVSMRIWHTYISRLLLTHRGPVTQYCGGSILCKNPVFFTMKEFPQI